MERQDKTAEGRLRAAFFLSGCGGAVHSALTQEFGEPAGIRTQDPMIKSHVLYRLSYRLWGAAVKSERTLVAARWRRKPNRTVCRRSCERNR